MKTLIALVVALTLGATLLAKDVTYAACTADKHETNLAVTIADDAPASVEAEVKAAFEKTANALTAAALVGREGYLTFMANLTDEDRDNIALSGPPLTSDAVCK